MVAVLESNERIHCVHMEGLVRARVRFLENTKRNEADPRLLLNEAYPADQPPVVVARFHPPDNRRLNLLRISSFFSFFLHCIAA
jgi:hypothetical protein